MSNVRRDPPALALVALLAAGLAAGACGRDADPIEPITELPRELSVAERQVIAASNTFGFELLRAVRAADPAAPNVVLSPVSVSMALGMALNGAAGATFEEMRAALRFGSLGQEEINAAYRGLLRLLAGLDPRVELGIANSTWARRGFAFEPSFFQAVRDHFDAEARELDFGLPTAKDTINAWVRAKTRGRIDAIVDEIRRDDILFLINAVYFKGGWATRFDPARTAPGPFRLEDGRTVTVPLMHGKDVPVSIGAVDGVMLAELPYGGGAFGMVVALPPEGTRLAALIERLDVATWARWTAALGSPGRANVTLPRFELRDEQVLNGPLQALGMTKAFQPYVADFSRLTPAEAYISKVKHKSFLKVDEAGTEAAAATSVGIGVVSLPPTVTVDRPFLLAVRERLSGTVLFLGAIGDPR